LFNLGDLKMAATYTTASGSFLVIPDSSIDVNVVSNPQGLSTTGVITLVGEADSGPHWSEEARLGDNNFGPGDINKVIAKYGSGRLVDAFKGAVAASNSTRIQGAPNRIILVKTNQGSPAEKVTNDGHSTFDAKLAGATGNSIKETISTNTDETAPSTGLFSAVPIDTGATVAAVRVNGGAEAGAININPGMTPADIAASFTNSNLNAVGGIEKNITSGVNSVSAFTDVISGQNVKFRLATPNVFANNPAVGDVCHISSGSPFDDGSDANVGWYLVTAVSNSATSAAISATKITLGAPVTATGNSTGGSTADIQCYSSMRINNMSGTDRDVLNGLGVNAAVTVAGASLTFTLAASNKFTTAPQIGDIMYIPAGTPFQGSGAANAGWYSVTAVSNTTSSAFVTGSRLSNGAPVAVSSTAITGSNNLQVLSRQIKGVGKALEIRDNAGSVNLSNVFKQLGVNTPAAFLSTTLTSASELSKKFTIAQSSQNKTETFVVGGNVAFTLGYKGTNATCTIQTVSGNKRLQTSVSGGLGVNLDINLSDVANLNDLASIINANTGYSAAVTTSLDGNRSATILDEVTAAGICSSIDNRRPGRIKRDVWDMTTGPNNVNGSTLIQITANVPAGLPEDEGPAFLTGGAKGATTALAMSQAIDACATVRCNFIVPLVSQDASADAAANLTDANSTYTVDAANAAARAHCIAMSTPKVKRHRVALCSKKDTFENAKTAAQNMSSFRVGMAFQDIKDLASDGTIKTFQPWMTATKVAGLQAAGFYKAIYNKGVQISGIVNPSGFDDQNQTDLENAILAGLMPVYQDTDGAFLFANDQLTYGTDNNFVYNSLQAVYVADIIALSLADACKKAFVGESVADVTPGVALEFIKGKMAEFLAKKLTIGQKGAEGGWKSIQVDIDQGVLSVRVVAIEATSVRFVPINLDIEGLKSSAAA
jgi:hypothetical protein